MDNHGDGSGPSASAENLRPSSSPYLANDDIVSVLSVFRTTRSKSVHLKQKVDRACSAMRQKLRAKPSRPQTYVRSWYELLTGRSYLPNSSPTLISDEREGSFSDDKWKTTYTLGDFRPSYTCSSACSPTDKHRVAIDPPRSRALFSSRVLPAEPERQWYISAPGQRTRCFTSIASPGRSQYGLGVPTLLPIPDALSRGVPSATATVLPLLVSHVHACRRRVKEKFHLFKHIKPAFEHASTSIRAAGTTICREGLRYNEPWFAADHPMIPLNDVGVLVLDTPLRFVSSTSCHSSNSSRMMKKLPPLPLEDRDISMADTLVGPTRDDPSTVVRSSHKSWKSEDCHASVSDYGVESSWYLPATSNDSLESLFKEIETMVLADASLEDYPTMSPFDRDCSSFTCVRSESPAEPEVAEANIILE